jgi:ABC-type uncharacterized transport system auxiliary subunit
MTASSLLRALVFMLLLLSGSGCALLSPPDPLTTLRLEPVPETIAWPAGLKPGRVTATSALQLDRVVVAQGALLMRHGELRWVDVPAVMMAESLRRTYASRRDAGAIDETGMASLDLWLTDFNLSVGDNGALAAVVSVVAELRCTPPVPLRPLAPVTATHALTRDDAVAIAAAFSSATRDVVAAVLATAAAPAASCSKAPTPG